MNDTPTESIDKIRIFYKYTLDFSNEKNTPDYILYRLFGKISNTIRNFHFGKKISKINEIIQNKKSETNKNILEKYAKEINEIEKTLENYDNNTFEEHFFASCLIENIEYKFKNKNINDDILLKGLITEILDNLVLKYIKYEKLFISLNDNLTDIINKLTLNF